MLTSSGKYRLHSGRSALQPLLRVPFEPDDGLCPHPRHDEGARRRLRQTRLFGVILTGAKRSLHPDLPSICRYATDQGLHVRMITNGWRMADKAFAKQMAEARNTSSSIAAVLAFTSSLRWNNGGRTSRSESPNEPSCGRRRRSQVATCRPPEMRPSDAPRVGFTSDQRRRLFESKRRSESKKAEQLGVALEKTDI